MSCVNDIDGLDPELKEQMKNAADKKEFVRNLQAENARKRKLAEMTKVKHAELMGYIDAHPKGAISGLRSILTNDLYGIAKNSNVEYRTHAIVGQTHAMMVDLIEALSTRKFGAVRDEALGDAVVHEIFGVESNNAAAKKYADQWRAASTMLRERFNAAGGAIDELDSWGMPQSHDHVKIAKATKQKWIEFVEPRLKNAEELDLGKVYMTIITGGMNKLHDDGLDPTKFMGGGKMFANKNNEARALHFKDGNTWLEYQKEFGREDPLSVMLDHVRILSTDTAMIEILGVNPDSMFKTLLRDAEMREQVGGGQSGYEGLTQAIYNVVSGRVDGSAAVSIASKDLELYLGTARSMQTATKLGSATLAAMTDMGTLFTNVEYHGMNHKKVMQSFIKNFDIDNQVKISRLGFAADIFNSTISSRFNEGSNGLTAKVAEGVIRASGLSMWTEAARKAFQYEFYNHLQDVSKDKTLNKIYKNYGWSKEEVDALDFDNLTMGQQTRLLEMVTQEGDYAVLMPNARVRAVTTGGHQKGTWTGEIFRTGTTFKSFPASFMIQQMSRVFLQNSGQDRYKYGGMLLASTTLLGGLAMSAKDASKGYDLRDGNPLQEDPDLKDEAKWWAAAMVQGGGAGILGDFLFQDQNRYGGGVASTIAGPTVGTAERATKLIFGNIQQALDPEDDATNFGSEAVEFVNREMNPANLFYTKMLIDKYAVEFFKELLDDEYAEARVRRDRKKRRESGMEKFDFMKPDDYDPVVEAQADVRSLRSKYVKRYNKIESKAAKRELSAKYKKDIAKIKESLQRRDRSKLKINLKTPTKRGKKKDSTKVFTKTKMIDLDM